MIDNYTLNDEGELVLDNPNAKSQEKWKKIAIISIALCLALIILIVIIILINISSKSNDKTKIKIGEILCTYDIEISSKPTPILSQEFDDSNRNFDISIENNIIEFSKNVTFNSTGYKYVRFILYGDINMQNMFKGIDSLLSIEMTSNKNGKIMSIESAFENCRNFNSFNMTGFDTSQIKSLRKLFYNTKVDSLLGFNMDTKNVQDFSYFFANTELSEID